MSSLDCALITVPQGEQWINARTHTGTHARKQHSHVKHLVSMVLLFFKCLISLMYGTSWS